jgi:glutamate racemase
MIIRRYLHPLKAKQIDTLVLGCTHYPLLKHLIQPRIGRRVKLIDSSETTARYLVDFTDKVGIKPSPGHSPEKNRYYLTDITEAAQDISNTIFNRTINILAT